MQVWSFGKHLGYLLSYLSLRKERHNSLEWLIKTTWRNDSSRRVLPLQVEEFEARIVVGLTRPLQSQYEGSSVGG